MPPDSNENPEFDEAIDSLDRFERIIDVQLSLIDALDETAVNVVWYTMLLVGAVFTALSVVSRSDALALNEVGVVPRVAFFVGVAGLVVAASMAVVTFVVTSVSSRRTYGPHPSWGDAVAEKTVRSPQYERLLLAGYAFAVRRNRQTVAVYVQQLHWTLGALFVGLIYSSLAGVLLVFDRSFPVELSIVIATTVVTGLYGHRAFGQLSDSRSRDLLQRVR
jgi:uncharacterized membrane protein (DUF485 family)